MNETVVLISISIIFFVFFIIKRNHEKSTAEKQHNQSCGSTTSQIQKLYLTENKIKKNTCL
jgi:hypothetical protein